MRRYIGRHTDRNTLRTVNQQIRETARQHHRLLLRLIKIRNKVHCVLVDVGNHLHRNMGESCLGISHGRRAVAINGSEVSVSVDQTIPHGPFLCHIDKSAVNR